MDKPRYIEALPRISIFDLLRAWKNDERLCEFSDERGRRLGSAWLIALNDSAVYLSYHLHGRYFTSGEDKAAAFRTELARNRHGGIQQFSCDGCRRRTTVLVFDGCWLCRGCHNLAYRKQFLTPAVIGYERMEALRKEIGGGRKKRSRNSKYAPLREELSALEAKYAKTGPQCACAEHSFLVTAKWMKIEDAHRTDVWCEIP